MKISSKPYDLAQLQLAPTATLLDAIRAINSGNVQIALVVNNCGKLIGTITDGDVRRALLRGETFETPVERVMYEHFYALPEGATDQEALTIMRRETVHQVPALDKDGKVIKLFVLEDLIKSIPRSNHVIIMAGGKGTRLLPLTNDCPKSMVPIGGRPLLEIIIDQCIEAGYQNFYLAVNYLKEQIQDYFGDGAHWKIQIAYLEEDMPLGTAGALSLLPEMPNEPFLMLNGDVLTRVDYSNLLRFHLKHGAAATLCVREHSTHIPYGVVDVSEMSVLAIEEKPCLSHYVNAGIYMLDPKILSLVSQNEYLDMPELLSRVMQHKQKLLAFPIHEYWLDVGHPSTLIKASTDWS